MSYTNINYLIFLYFLKYKMSIHTHILYLLKVVFDLSFSYLLWLKNNIFQIWKSSTGIFNEGNKSLIKCNIEKWLFNINKWKQILFAFQTLVWRIIFWIDFIENCQEKFSTEVFNSDSIYFSLHLPRTLIVSNFNTMLWPKNIFLSCLNINISLTVFNNMEVPKNKMRLRYKLYK